MNSLSLRHDGFSLIELTFSMAIGSIILILAATLLGTSSDGYERICGGITSEREARATITQLSSDLATAVFHPSGVIENSNTAWPLDRIGFLSLQPESAQTESSRIGDLCAVNYYIKDLTIHRKTIRCLMRGFRESRDTFQALHDENTAPLFQPRLHLDEPIAFGIISFEARPKRRDSDGKWIDWIRNDSAGPEAFEMKIVIARPTLTGKLKLPADWDGRTPDRDQDLDTYATILRFGNHARR